MPNHPARVFSALCRGTDHAASRPFPTRPDARRRLARRQRRASPEPRMASRPAGTGGVFCSGTVGPSCVLHKPPQRGKMPAGIALIKRFEGCQGLRRDGMIEANSDPGPGTSSGPYGWAQRARYGEWRAKSGRQPSGAGANGDARLADDLVRTYAAKGRPCDWRCADQSSRVRCAGKLFTYIREGIARPRPESEQPSRGHDTARAGIRPRNRPGAGCYGGWSRRAAEAQMI